MKNIRPSTKNRFATIFLSQKQKEKIAQIGPDFFVSIESLPKGTRLTIAEDEALSESARKRIKGNILEVH